MGRFKRKSMPVPETHKTGGRGKGEKEKYFRIITDLC